MWDSSRTPKYLIISLKKDLQKCRYSTSNGKEQIPATGEVFHSTDNETEDQQDRLYKLRPLVDKNFSGLQIPNEMLAIDKTMIKF